MSKIIMVTGVPRSGKTTYAKKFVEESGNYVRVNKDDLRTMMFNYKFTNKNESLVMDTHIAIVRDMIRRGMSVIIDDTNIGEYYEQRWRTVAKELNAEFEIKKIETPHPLELLKRDDESTSKRGSHTIMKFLLDNKDIQLDNDNIVLCDLDGTLCEVKWRLNHINGETKDWKSFFENLVHDPLREDVFEMIKEYQKQGKRIIFMSGRSEEYYDKSINWLKEHGFDYEHNNNPDAIPFVALLMRASHDRRDDTIVKHHLFQRYLNKEAIHKVLDDRPSVIRMWRDLAELDVIDVGDGIDF